MGHYNRQHFAGIWAAQEARKQMREGDPLYASGQEATRFQRGGQVVDTRPLERDVQSAVLQALAVHPKVAWAHRMNSGGVWYSPTAQTFARWRDESHTRYIRFAFKGCSDILGQLKDGRIFVCECKRPGEDPTDEQASFLALVARHHGLAIVARSVDDVIGALA